MTNHRVTIVGSTQQCQARCSCKKKSPVGDRGLVEAWWYSHQQDVERIRAHLGSRTPSLKTQYEWFVKQAENTDNEYDDRVLWRQLADEIERHIASQQPMRQTEALF